MTRVLLFTIGLSLASAAHADVSDSGNLTIGGTAVIQGTMTVQGSAFSVGGATFSVAGGSITLGGLLNAAPTGIKWADGSTSTTAFSGGGGTGNVVLTATQTFSGANTFTSSVTISGTVITGPAAYSSTAAVTGRLLNGWNTVAISSFQNVSQVFLYGLSSSTTYRGSCDLYKRSTGDIFVQLNGDTGGNYYFSGPMCPSNGAGCTHLSGTSATGVQLTGYSNPLQNGTPASILFTKISSGYGLPTKTWFHGTVGSDDAQIRAIARTFSAYYNGSANLSQLRVYTNSGTFDGQCIWEQFISGL